MPYPVQPADENQRNGAELCVIHARLLAYRMVGADVGRFMGHYAGQFGFFIGIKNQAGIDVEEAAGQGHGVDFVRIDDLDGEGHLAVGVLDDVLPDAIDVFGDNRIGDEAGALLDLHGVTLAHLDFGVGRVPVAHSAAADIAIAYRADVLDAARLDVDFLAADFNHLLRIDIGSGNIALHGLRSRPGRYCLLVFILVLVVLVFLVPVSAGDAIAEYRCCVFAAVSFELGVWLGRRVAGHGRGAWGRLG